MYFFLFLPTLENAIFQIFPPSEDFFCFFWSPPPSVYLTASTAETFAKKYGYKFNSSETTRLKGDVDNNGIINVVDATDIQKYVVNLTDENGNKFIDVNNAEDVYVADVNGDGIINVVDATLIQKYIVRLVESLW